MKKICYIMLLVSFLISCETRKDINRERNITPQIDLSTEMYGHYDLEIIDTLQKASTKTYYYRSSDDSNIDLIHTLELEFDETSAQIKDSVIVTIDESTNRIIVENILNDKIINSKSYSFNIYVVVTDNYGLSSRAKIVLTLIENRPPIPNVIFNKLSNTDYEILATGSADPDGDNIVAYEYLIDGKIIYNNPGYEGDYESMANPNPGHAATEGTYIISTPLSSIKHNFHLENVSDFKIYVRVKDSRGLWSSWEMFSL